MADARTAEDAWLGVAVHLSKLAGWRGVVLGIVLVGLGIWAVAYTCNTETAACKGLEPWPTMPWALHAVGWAAVALGLVTVIAALGAWISRAAGSRRPKV
jgi:CHASE1-domain containing sensor protein